MFHPAPNNNLVHASLFQKLWLNLPISNMIIGLIRVLHLFTSPVLPQFCHSTSSYFERHRGSGVCGNIKVVVINLSVQVSTETQNLSWKQVCGTSLSSKWSELLCVLQLQRNKELPLRFSITQTEGDNKEFVLFHHQLWSLWVLEHFQGCLFMLKNHLISLIQDKVELPNLFTDRSVINWH